MPNITYNKHAKQYVVYLCTRQGGKAHYLGKDKKEVTRKYHAIVQKNI